VQRAPLHRAEAGAGQTGCVHVAIFDDEHARELGFPRLVGGGDPAERERALASIAATVGICAHVGTALIDLTRYRLTQSVPRATISSW